MRMILYIVIIGLITLGACSPMEEKQVLDATTTSNEPTVVMTITQKDFERELKKQFNEVRVSIGISNQGHLTTLYTSLHGESWTILITTTDGRFKVVDSGMNWINYPPEPETLEGAL